MTSYDLAVVGSGIAGLAAAATASKIGKRTILFEPGQLAGGSLASFHKDGFVFAPGPTVLYGFERGGVFQSLAERLSMGHQASLRSPCYQVALPDRRITVSAEQSETLEELRREFPREIDRIARFYLDIRKLAERIGRSRVAAFVSRNRSTASLLVSRRFSLEFTLFLDMQARYFFGRALRSLRASELVMLVDAAPFTVPGGMTRIAELLADAVLRNNGEIRHGVSLSTIALRPHGIEVQGALLSAGSVLLNLPEHRGRSLCFVVKAQVIPTGMLPVVLVAPSYDTPDCFFTLSLNTPGAETARQSERSLVVWFSSGFGGEDDASLTKRVSAIMPFLADFTVLRTELPVQVEKVSLPGDISLKRVRASGYGCPLQRSVRYGLWSVPDSCCTPGDAVVAAQRLIELTQT